MKRPTVDECLQQGIHGPLETKPEERRKYLGTLRERIIVVLKKGQVREKELYPQIDQNMKKFTRSHLFLNGDIGYSDLSKYIKLAVKNKIDYTIVSNQEHKTDIGLVLAMDYAIDKEDIYISRRDVLKEEIKKNKGLLKKIFKR